MIPVSHNSAYHPSAQQLELRRQQLQQEILLLQATGTDGAAASADRQKQISEALEEIQTRLPAAKTSEARQIPSKAEAYPRQDSYQPEHPTPSTGLYQVQKTASGYVVSLLPYRQE